MQKRTPPPVRRDGEGRCEGCGAPSPAGQFHVAVHDCKTGEWDLITITPKGWGEVDALRSGT